MKHFLTAVSEIYLKEMLITNVFFELLALHDFHHLITNALT